MAVIEIKVIGDPFDVIPVKQLAEKTKRSVSQVNNMIVSIDTKTGETKLDICYPFPNKPGENSGMKFIVVNDKCKNFIKYCEKNPIEK
jgi:hypothetical protein